MEKRVATYDLKMIKLTFSEINKLRVTATALQNTRTLGFTQQDMVDAIQQLTGTAVILLSHLRRNNMKCHACKKGILQHKTKPQVFTYKNKSITLEQPGSWCNSCEEGVLSGEDIAKTEKAFQKFKATVDALLSPKEIRHIRKDILNLTQSEAGKIFGGGKNGFSRYERGEIKPPAAISNLLKILEHHPGDLKYIY
jgi:HTH-type transcriptional regulator/antitoxin MqsA